MPSDPGNTSHEALCAETGVSNPMQAESGGSVTLATIARSTGYNKSTVSRALRGTLVNPQTAQRIRAIANEMGYEPERHHAARRLASRKSGQRLLSNVLAVFFPRNLFQAPYYLRVVEGIMAACQEQAFSLLALHDNHLDTGTVPPVFARGDVDAAIAYASPRSFTRSIDILRSANGFGRRPIVSLLNTMPGCSAILAEEEAGGYRAVRHLLDLGHRHILHFSPASPNSHVLWQRLGGYVKACRDAGLDPDDVLHYSAWKQLRPEASSKLLGAALDRWPETTAILARNDHGVAVIRECLQQRGLSIPRDISIVGYDDSEPLPDDHGRNMLTTVHVPLLELGQEAARMAIRQLTAASSPEPEEVTLPVELIVRASTAPPRHT